MQTACASTHTCTEHSSCRICTSLRPDSERSRGIKANTVVELSAPKTAVKSGHSR